MGAFEFANGLLKRWSLHWLGRPAEREQAISRHRMDAYFVRLIADDERDGFRS